jgi:murein L,D-transpeptidase YafK
LINAQPTDTSPTHRTWLHAWLALVILIAAPALRAQQQTWLLVDTHRMTLSVMQGDRAKRTYRNISIGRGGATRDKHRHDDATPLGRFHISWISRHTAFRRFFGIDYPNMQRAERALKAGIISGREYGRIRQAFRSHKTPPQDTPLGGYIGIHGLGEADARIHADFNWTNGCVALTNEQIDDLAHWVHVGMPVVIR